MAPSALFVAALSPVILFAALEIASRGTPHKPHESRPRQAVFPYVGVSLLPLVLLLASKVWSWRPTMFLPLRLLKKAGVAFLVLAYLGHNFFTLAYGNVNNEAFTTSLMIDIIASPEDFNKLINIPSDQFEVYSNPTVWANESIIKGPHLDIQGVHDAKCGPRQFRRFMFHRILAESKASKVFDSSTMMGGLWTIVHGVDALRRDVPKLYTDYVLGNHPIANRYILRELFVDRLAFPTTYNNSITDDRWIIRSTGASFYPGEIIVDATLKTNYSSNSYIMDQYSCLTESYLLQKVVNRNFCFFKFMETTATTALEGTFQHPLLAKGSVAFPSGDAADCSKPYVRAVLGQRIHWRRDNYSC